MDLIDLAERLVMAQRQLAQLHRLACAADFPLRVPRISLPSKPVHPNSLDYA